MGGIQSTFDGKSDENPGTFSTWRTLRWFWSQTGQRLWETRAWGRKSAKDGVFQTREHPVCPYLVTDAKAACRILDTKPVDQFVQRDTVGKIEKRDQYMKHSLTGCIGDRWVDTRRRLKRDVFCKVFPRVNIPIATRVAKAIQTSFQESVEDGGRLELKRVLVPLLADWICELVLGETCTESIRNLLVKYWKHIRRPEHVRKAQFQANREQTVPRRKTPFQYMLEQIEALNIAPGNDCLVAAMKAAGFAQHEMTGNMLSFLVAGFETTLHVTMTTLLMIAHKGKSSRYARSLQKHCVDICNDKALNRKSIGELKAGKKMSTTGVPLGQAFPASFSNGSTRLLSRSILETLLRFPPVWDLPRLGKVGSLCPMLAQHSPNINPDQLVEFHIDLMCCNNVGRDPVRAWNPCAPLRADQHLFSFGVGARSCPGGSTSVAAIHTFLAPILAKFRLRRETSVTEVLSKSYLMPTLNFDSPLNVIVENVN